MYKVNEVFLSIQGEGVRAGTANVFVRFTGCNLQCSQEPGPKSPGGFDCDTEFASGRKVTMDELMQWIETEAGSCRWVILTGGEPGLQVDETMLATIHSAGFQVAIETNGSVELPKGIDWVTVSPKVAEHCIRQKIANEVKYVRSHGQSIPKTCVTAEHHLISPGFDGNHLNQRNYQWCIELIKQNPSWRLSMQSHKIGLLIR